MIYPVTRFEIDYELTRDDLVAFQLYAMKSSRTARRFGRRTRITYAIVIVIMAALTSPWSSTIAAGGFLIACVTFLGLSWALTRVLTRRAIMELVSDEVPEKGHLGRHHIEFDENGIVETTAVGESRVSWAGIDRIERNSDHVLVYTTPSAAHMIPRRAFATPDDEKAAYEFVESMLATERQK